MSRAVKRLGDRPVIEDLRVGDEERLPPASSPKRSEKSSGDVRRVNELDPRRSAGEDRDDSLGCGHEEIADRRLPGAVDRARPEDRVREARPAPHLVLAETGTPSRLGPAAACDETRTKWASGASCSAARATFAVPPALEAMYSSSLRAEVFPAACTTAEAPATSAPRHDGSRTSPVTISTGMFFSQPGSSGRRASARTRKPAPTSASARWLPTKPVPPVSAARSRGSKIPSVYRTDRLASGV
jgi:hypothetical protein